MTFAKQVIRFYNSLKFGVTLPDSCMVMNPYRQEKVRKNVEAFYRKYYPDNRKNMEEYVQNFVGTCKSLKRLINE